MARYQMEKLDVGALRTLLTIYDCKSFSETARRMGVTQSTTSYTVSTLRESFADPLFVRVGNMVEPTERCRKIASELRPVLTALDGLAASSPFDPAEADSDIAISCNFHERLWLLPDALRAIRAAAPHLRIHLYEAAVHGKRQLIENKADIVVAATVIIGDIFYQRALFTDRYVCVMDRDNPLAKSKLTLEKFKEADHLAITHNGEWEALFYPLLRAKGINLRPCINIPSHDNIEHVLAGSNLIGSIPERLAVELSDQFVLRPFPIETSIQVNMYWTEKTHHSGLHKWVRQILTDTTHRLWRTYKTERKSRG